MDRIKTLFFVILFPYWITASLPISESLKQVSESDKEDLEQFFRLLIQNNEMGYTLFGTKPITVYDFFKFTYSYPCTFHCLILEKGWNAWIRNKHLFPSERFAFKREESKGLSTLTHLYLINKKYAFEKICKYLDLFKEKLGEEISAEKILERLCSDEPIHQVLSSKLLLGIFFGYGENNARAFKTFSLSLPLIARDQITKKFGLVGNDILLEEFCSPRFISCDTNESNELEKLYSNTRTFLKKAYTEESFLVVTLNQWVFSNDY